MKKIKLTESQVTKLLNESPYKKIKAYSQTKLLSGKGTLGSSDLNNICDVLYDAIDGPGTTKPDILNSFNRCKNLHDVINVFSRFRRRKGEDLMVWLDDDIDFDTTWDKYVLRPIANAASVSRQEGHFNAPKEDATSTLEQSIIKTFPCIKDTPGYKFQRDSGTDGIKFGSDEGNFGLKTDGTLYYYNKSQSKYVAFEKKTQCVGVKYSSLGEEISEAETGLNLNPDGLSFSAPDTPGEKAVEPTTTDTGKSDGTATKAVEPTTTGDTETKTVEPTTGGSVKDFQQKLKDAGFESVGSVDGRLGPKTAKAAMEFIKSKGLLSETDELPLNEQISQNFKRFL